MTKNKPLKKSKNAKNPGKNSLPKNRNQITFSARSASGASLNIPRAPATKTGASNSSSGWRAGSSNSPLNTKTQFREAVSYLRESKKYVYASVIIFFVSAVFAFAMSENLRFLDKILLELIDETQNLNGLEMVFFILQNNFQSALFSVVAGIALGISPIVSAISNGALIGYVLARTYEIAGISSWWRLLPHGIFELPAIFISFGLGIKLGLPLAKNFFKYYWKKSKITLAIPAVIAIIFSFANNYVNIPSELQELASVITALVFLAGIIFVYLIFIVGASIFNERLKKTQSHHLNKNIYKTANTFFMIVIPLLIIAAVIEGILIYLLG